MASTLLREYVSLMLEKIRSKKGSAFGDKFDMKTFGSLDNINMLEGYVESFLEQLGRGSSRAAYVLSSRYALKIAINQKGIAQNKTEVEVFTSPQTKAVVAKVYKADPDFKWVIADLVRPLKTPEEFEKLTGENFYTFLNQVADFKQNKQTGEKMGPLAQAAAATVKSSDLQLGDLKFVDHWGKTPDGRVVLLDYGFTGEVWEKHYSKSRPAKEPTGTRKDTPRDDATRKDTQTSPQDAATRKSRTAA